MTYAVVASPTPPSEVGGTVAHLVDSIHTGRPPDPRPACAPRAAAVRPPVSIGGRPLSGAAPDGDAERWCGGRRRRGRGVERDTPAGDTCNTHARRIASAALALARAHAELHRAAAAANAQGLLDRVAVRALAREYKLGARARAAGSVDGMRRIAARYTELAAGFHARLVTPSLSPVVTSSESVTQGGISPGGGPRTGRGIERETTRGVSRGATREDARTARGHSAGPRRRRATRPAVEFAHLGGPEHVRFAKRPPTPDEMSDAERADAVTRAVIVHAMQRGRTARQALAAADVPFTPAGQRWAQREFRKYTRYGVARDRRADRTHARTVMTSTMQSLVYALWMKHRGAKAPGIQRLVRRYLRVLEDRLAAGEPFDADAAIVDEATVRAGGPVPAVTTIRGFLRALPRVVHRQREGGMRELHRQERPVVPCRTAERANEEWEFDNCKLQLYVRVRRRGEWRAVPAHLTACIDVYSTIIPGHVVSARTPDAWSTAHLLRAAMLGSVDGAPGRGRFQRAVMDRGMDFKSGATRQTLALIGTESHYCKPRNPDEKPRIERWFRTIQEDLLPTLPGYQHGADRGAAWTAGRVMGLLTVPQLRAEIAAWVREYHARPRLPGEPSREQRWRESAGLVAPVTAEDLDALLLKSDETRRIVRGTVRFTAHRRRPLRYFAENLAPLNGREVAVRYNPDDLESILLYDVETGVRLGEAWRVRASGGRYTREDVRRAARAFEEELRLRQRGLLERLPAYFAEAGREDRPTKAEVRAAAREVAAAPPPAAIHHASGGGRQAAAARAQADALRQTLAGRPAPEPPAAREDPPARDDPRSLVATLRGVLRRRTA